MFGHGENGPSDRMVGEVCTTLWKDKNARERISHLCCSMSNPAVAEVEQAYQLYKSTIASRKKLKQWQSNYKVYYYDKSFADLVSLAVGDQVMSEDEAQSLIESEDLRQKAIAVDVF